MRRLYEIYGREKAKRPRVLLATFRGRHWQFAIKHATKLHRSGATDLVIREIEITHEMKVIPV